ncbi:MAG: hypothetical protein ABSE82_08410 [Nitrososphaerales archaeon]|jgi:hypothetical protein
MAGLDETTLKIMDVLSRQIGNPISINELKNKIEATYGSANYAGIHAKLRSLTEDQITNSETTGKASIATLNFRNWFTSDLLTQTDIWKKQEILRRHPELQMILSGIYRNFDDINFIKSMSIINPEQNLALNRAEFLVLINIPEDQTNQTNESIISIHTRMQALEKRHNIRINNLIITTHEFINLLKSEEANPLREMLPNRINFISPQSFWNEFMIASEQGLRIKFETKETEPTKIPEEVLTYNLRRFGYKEFGTDLIHGKDICIEYIITSILLSGDARRIEAIPVILAKNKVNHNLLNFLSQKYDFGSKLLGLLKALDKYTTSDGSLKDAITILESIGTREIPADEESIKENLSLYSVAPN